MVVRLLKAVKLFILFLSIFVVTHVRNHVGMYVRTLNYAKNFTLVMFVWA